MVLLDLIGDHIDDFFVETALVAANPDVFIFVRFKCTNQSSIFKYLKLTAVGSLVDYRVMKYFPVAGNADVECFHKD